MTVPHRKLQDFTGRTREICWHLFTWGVTVTIEKLEPSQAKGGDVFAVRRTSLG